jgi:hypothetical protein
MKDDSGWAFADPPNVAVITVKQVLREGMPVLYVSHDEDDGGGSFSTVGRLLRLMDWWWA